MPRYPCKKESSNIRPGAAVYKTPNVGEVCATLNDLLIEK